MQQLVAIELGAEAVAEPLPAAWAWEYACGVVPVAGANKNHLPE